MVEVLVALISTAGLVLVAVLTNEGRKARQALGTRKDGDMSLLELITGMYSDLISIKATVERQDDRLISIETSVESIDGRVVHLEDLAGIQTERNKDADAWRQQMREAQR